MEYTAPRFAIWPLSRERFWISSFFGWRSDRRRGRRFHYGLDLAAPKGTAIRSVAAGLVTEARYAAGYGNTVLVQHSPKLKTRYAHLQKISVKVGQKIDQGELVGTVGNTGFVVRSGSGDASHLHFEVYEGKQQVNPLKFLPQQRCRILRGSKVGAS